jgi:hypothetical protein
MLVVLAPLAAPQVPTPEADALFAKGDWSGAAREFQRATETHPDDGRAWFRLASTMHRLGKYDEAIRDFESAAKLNFQAPYATAAMARAYAAAGQTDQAIAALDCAAKSGFAMVGFLDTDRDFKPLEKLPAYAAIHERVRLNGQPCLTGAQYKQFDFWLGDWDVEVGGQKIARSHIEKISGGCIVQENWMPSNGLQGKSWNFFNSATGKWEQLWIGPGGGALKLEGELRDGAMRYNGTTPRQGGPATEERLTFTPLENRAVRQHWEQSADGGKTWTVVFDGVYRPNDSIEAPMSAAERSELIEHLKSSRRVFHEVLRGVTPEQAKFKPSPERWSILECAEHIAQAEKLLFADALDGLSLAPGGPGSKVAKEALLKVWGTAATKVKSSGDFDPAGRWPDLASIEKVFDARRQRSLDFATETERDLRSRICCGDLDIWQQILAMSAHTLRHIQQINDVKADPNYPKRG